MWPIKEKENRQLLRLWPNLIPYSKLQEMRRRGSLININPPGKFPFFTTPVFVCITHTASEGSELMLFF